MKSRIESFEEFVNENWGDGPGSVSVPGEWYKTNVNSRNYRPANTQLPQVVDTMYGSTDLYSYMDSLSEEEGFAEFLKKKYNDLQALEGDAPSKAQQLAELKEAVSQLKKVEKGTLSTRPAQALLDEL
jgi:hypothetical protein